MGSEMCIRDRPTTQGVGFLATFGPDRRQLPAAKDVLALEASAPVTGPIFKVLQLAVIDGHRRFTSAVIMQ